MGRPIKSWLGAFVVSALMLAQPLARDVSYADIFGDKRYWPPKCTITECTLTGLGGIIGVWLQHVDKHERFVVRGVCASACEMAYRYARDIGKSVRIAPGARLIPHHVPGEYVSP